LIRENGVGIESNLRKSLGLLRKVVAGVHGCAHRDKQPQRDLLGYRPGSREGHLLSACPPVRLGLRSNRSRGSSSDPEGQIVAGAGGAPVGSPGKTVTGV
jgi:hypothetical protein